MSQHAEFIRKLTGEHVADLREWCHDDLWQLAIAQRDRIEELENLSRALAERCHGQSELLAKRAMKAEVPPEPDAGHLFADLAKPTDTRAIKG